MEPDDANFDDATSGRGVEVCYNTLRFYFFVARSFHRDDDDDITGIF